MHSCRRARVRDVPDAGNAEGNAPCGGIAKRLSDVLSCVRGVTRCVISPEFC